MYQKLPNLVLGFHGCNQDVYNYVIRESGTLKASNNTYDWLGNGIYFWEQNYQRAFEWAYNRYKEKAAVIGAVIDLGRCLNLTDNSSSEILRKGYELLSLTCQAVNSNLPQNRGRSKDGDLLLRDLDCAVIQQIHDYNKQTENPSFDSVRGIFVEGQSVYAGSGFMEKTHIQLCIRNPNCIKGYFSPMSKNDNFDMP